LRTHSICFHIVPITSSLLQQRGLAGKIFAYLLRTGVAVYKNSRFSILRIMWPWGGME
jgi:hypothetical protein